MLKLSKKVEYAILSLQYMACSKSELVTAKELSDSLEISFEFLSKTLQVLMKRGLIESHQGIRGGYQLAKKPEDISLNEVIHALEKNSGITECLSEKDILCSRMDKCTIKSPLTIIQKKINEFLNMTTIAQLAKQN
ncbi:MAG: hypothetical protein QG635_298 [Bacteroidota bacterium]|nr:hypothetical protein [Bacteroidota bacterium]